MNKEERKTLCKEEFRNCEMVREKENLINFLEDEKDRLARECSQIYEDDLGKTRLVNEVVFEEVNKILEKVRSSKYE